LANPLLAAGEFAAATLGALAAVVAPLLALTLLLCLALLLWSWRTQRQRRRALA
jgi:hypothetical protein